MNLELGRVQTLQPGLYGVLRGSAQFATQPLYLAEQFAALYSAPVSAMVGPTPALAVKMAATKELILRRPAAASSRG